MSDIEIRNSNPLVTAVHLENFDVRTVTELEKYRYFSSVAVEPAKSRNIIKYTVGEQK